MVAQSPPALNGVPAVLTEVIIWEPQSAIAVTAGCDVRPPGILARVIAGAAIIRTSETTRETSGR